MLFDLYESLEHLAWRRLAETNEQAGAVAVLEILRYRLTRLVQSDVIGFVCFVAVQKRAWPFAPRFP